MKLLLGIPAACFAFFLYCFIRDTLADQRARDEYRRARAEARARQLLTKRSGADKNHTP